MRPPLPLPLVRPEDSCLALTLPQRISQLRHRQPSTASRRPLSFQLRTAPTALPFFPTMRLSFFLAALVAAPSALALASAPEAEVPTSAPADQSPALALHTDHKRSLCLFGFCIGGSGGDAGGSTGGGWSSTPSTPDYMNDENNCGRAGNRCPTSCSNGSGAVCVQGRCLPRYCSPGFVRNDATATCVNLASDPSNW